MTLRVWNDSNAHAHNYLARASVRDVTTEAYICAFLIPPLSILYGKSHKGSQMALMCLYGWQRRLSLVPLGLFVVGWLVFTVGMIWSLISSERATDGNQPASQDPADPTYFPFYVALIGGPVIYVLGVLHAMLSGVAGALLGIFVAFLNVVYFSSVSWIAYDRGRNVSLMNSTPRVSSDANSQAWLMFDGTLFTLICWCVVLILAVFYKDPDGLNPRHSQDSLTACTRAAQTGSKLRPFPGAARFFSVPFLILSVIGWCVFVAGYHQWNTDHDTNTPLVVVFDDHTNPIVVAVLIIGPLLYLASLLHAGCSGRASTMGVLTAILHALYVASSGTIIMHLTRLNISSNSTTKQYVDYMLGGCAASLLLWTLVYALRPFYQDFHRSGESRARGNARDLSESPEGGHRDSPPPDYGTATAQVAHTPQMREGDQETQPLLAESAQ